VIGTEDQDPVVVLVVGSYHLHVLDKGMVSIGKDELGIYLVVNVFHGVHVHNGPVPGSDVVLDGVVIHSIGVGRMLGEEDIEPGVVLGCVVCDLVVVRGIEGDPVLVVGLGSIIGDVV